MEQPAKGSPSKPRKIHPDQKVDAAQKREKAETAEVLGRHKNAGQKDHKGAR